MKLEKVEITWLDSKGITSSWEYKDEIEPLKPIAITSIGYLLEDANEYKPIAQIRKRRPSTEPDKHSYC